jgi:hypothetical protein
MVKTKKMRWARHVAHMGDNRNAYRVLVGKPEEKRPLGGMDWIHLAQDRDQWRDLVNTAMNLRVP